VAPPCKGSPEKRVETKEVDSNKQNSFRKQPSIPKDKYEELQSDYDLLGKMEMDNMEDLVSIADNLAIKLAYDTTIKLKNLKSKFSGKIGKEIVD